jgi:hypothetical protein
VVPAGRFGAAQGVDRRAADNCPLRDAAGGHQAEHQEDEADDEEDPEQDLAIVAAPAAMSVKPNAAAMMAMMKKMSAHFSMERPRPSLDIALHSAGAAK